MRMPGPRRGFDPVRIVKVNPQLIDGVLADNRQLLRAGLPRHLMLLKQREKRRRPDPVHQRVEKHTVVEQIVDLRRAQVMRGAGAWVGHLRIEDAANGPGIAEFAKSLHHAGGRQHLMVVPLHPGAGVLLIGPAQGIQIDPGLHHNWLIKGKPAGHLRVVAGKDLLRVAHKQLNHRFRPPAAILFQQIAGQFIMLKADHRRDAVGQQRIEQLVVIGRILLIHRDVFIVDQKARPVDRGAVVGQPGQLHQLHVFLKAVNKIGSHRRAIAVMPDVAVVFVPEIGPGVLPRFFPAPALGLPGGSRRAKDKIIGNGHPYGSHRLLRQGWRSVDCRPDAVRHRHGGRQF